MRTTRRRGARARAAPRRFRDARRGSSDDASESSLHVEPSLAGAPGGGSGGFQNASRRFSHCGERLRGAGEHRAAARDRARRSPRRTPPRGAPRGGACSVRSTWRSPRRFRGGRLDEPGGGAAARGHAQRALVPEALFQRSTVSALFREEALRRATTRFRSRRERLARRRRTSGEATGGERRGLEPVHGARRRARSAARSGVFSHSETPGPGTEAARDASAAFASGVRTGSSPRGGRGRAIPRRCCGSCSSSSDGVSADAAAPARAARGAAGARRDTSTILAVEFSRIVGVGERFRRRRHSRPPPNAFDLVRRNAVEEVTRLVETRLVSVHQLDADGNSLLMWACARGHRRLTKFLLKRGAAVNGAAVGDTPLHFLPGAGGTASWARTSSPRARTRPRRTTLGATPYEGMV